MVCTDGSLVKDPGVEGWDVDDKWDLAVTILALCMPLTVVSKPCTSLDCLTSMFSLGVECHHWDDYSFCGGR